MSLNIKKVMDNYGFNNGSNDGYFIKVDDFLDMLNINYTFESLYDLMDCLNDSGSYYLGDKISEYCDDIMVDIYYYTLREWAVDNYGYIEEAVDAFGIGEKFDFHGVIQQGQYLAYTQEMNELVSKFLEYIENNYKI
jgi:hypothetical protein